MSVRDIPSYVFSTFLLENPDIHVAASSILATKDMRDEILPHLPAIAVAQFTKEYPELVKLYETYSQQPFVTAITSTDIKICKLVDALRNCRKVINAKKGERFRPYLDCFLDASLFYENNTKPREVIFLNTLMFIYILCIYSETWMANTKVSLQFWFMYLSYDYLWHMYTEHNKQACPIIHNIFFKQMMSSNLLEMRSRNYKHNMGPVRSYTFERMTQKLFTVMFSLF